jgi:hypothetical protein
MWLYRAVSQEELDGVISFGGFRLGPGQMETKLFATSAEDAASFARDILYPLDHKPCTVVEVEISQEFGYRLFRFTLFGKPTVAVDHSQLDELNVKGQIRMMNASPIP